MVNLMHNINWYHNMVIRFIIFILIAICLYCFTEPMVKLLMLFKMDREYIIENCIFYSLFVSKCILIVIFLFSKISHKIKHFINMLVLVGIMTFIFIALLLEVLSRNSTQSSVLK